MEFVPCRFIDPDKSKTEFFSTLRKRVDLYFRENNISRNASPGMVIKTIILLSAYILPLLYIMLMRPSFGLSLILWLVIGLAFSGIGMSVMHDANHGAYSSSSRVNFWLGSTLNLLGGSTFNWKLQHNILHHTYTNIVHMDDDIDDKLILRFSPHTRVKWYHKFQVVYAFLFYCILTLYWGLLKDFVQFRKYTAEKVNKCTQAENRIILAKIVLSKLIYYFAVIVLPVFILKLPALQYITGYLLAQFVSGLVLTVIFQLAHTVEETTHPLPDENYTIENSWAIHQMNTTVNFCRNNKLLSWYVGGLNFQVEHHLFPNICHVHYPAIAPIVKVTAEEYGIKYLEHESFASAILSHVKTLQRFGKLPDLNEAIA
jgi:linoleoyl-CoA desaturase